MDSQIQLRNLKDFLMLYNQMTERCFSKCISSMNSRSLERDEEHCVSNCSSKFISANHRMMSVYVDVQSVLVTKRIEEAEATAAAQRNTTSVEEQS